MGGKKFCIPKRRFKEFQNADAWEQRKLGELIVKGGSGGTPNTSNKMYYEGIIPFLSITDLSNSNGYIYDTEKHISEEGLINSSAWIVPKESIALAMYASVGKVAILKDNIATSQAFYNMILSNENTRNYLYQYLKKMEINDEWEPLISTGTQANLNSEKVKNLVVALPSSIEEQEVISNYMNGLDHLITLHQRKLEKMKSMKAAYLTEMFPQEGEVVPKRRFSGFTDAWEQRKLGEISDVRDGTHASPKYFEKGHPFVTSKNVGGGFINYKDIQYISDEDFEEINKRSKVDVNDILMGMIGTIGNIALIRTEPDFAIKNVALIKDTKQVEYLYIYHYLQSTNVEKQLASSMDGGTQKFIALGKIRDLDILLPSKQEQVKLGKYFESLDNLITLHQRKLDKLQNIKKAYLNEMFI